MTIIVDANATHRMFNGDAFGAEVYSKIVEGKFIYITGGQHFDEVLLAGMTTRRLRELLLSGRARKYGEAQCATGKSQMQAHRSRKSDDPHILALALISGCRLLVSSDADLRKDFKNKLIIDNPRGAIVQTAAHLKKIRKIKPPL